MICVACRRRQHQDCPNGSWCDCQHQPPSQSSESVPNGTAESALSWVRQG
jgi:hypothetical protein